MPRTVNCAQCGRQQPGDDISTLKARIDGLEDALRFYRDEWQLNGDGDSETPGLSRSWMEPTDALHNDEGRKAAALLQPKAGS